jgi:hypothetical protein
MTSMIHFLTFKSFACLETWSGRVGAPGPAASSLRFCVAQYLRPHKRLQDTIKTPLSFDKDYGAHFILHERQRWLRGPKAKRLQPDVPFSLIVSFVWLPRKTHAWKRAWNPHFFNAASLCWLSLLAGFHAISTSFVRFVLRGKRVTS